MSSLRSSHWANGARGHRSQPHHCGHHYGHHGHHLGHHGHHLGHHGHHHGPVVGPVGPEGIDHGLTKTWIITQRSHCTTARARNARMHPTSRAWNTSFVRRRTCMNKISIITPWHSPPTAHIRVGKLHVHIMQQIAYFLAWLWTFFNRHQHKLQTCYQF